MDDEIRPACEPNDIMSFLAAKEIDLIFDPFFNPEAIGIKGMFESPPIHPNCRCWTGSPAITISMFKDLFDKDLGD